MPLLGKIPVGVTSWTEKTLIDSGEFYPRDVNTPEDRLRYYATLFRVVEVDSSYYGIPAERELTLRCRIYDCRLNPVCKKIGQSLALRRESIYAGLAIFFIISQPAQDR